MEHFSGPGHLDAKLDAVIPMYHWLFFRQGQPGPDKFQLGDLWIAGVSGGGMPRGLELVEQLEALLLLGWRRRGKGQSWGNLVNAVHLEATRRVDLEVIAAAGLGAELVKFSFYYAGDEVARFE